MTILLIAAGSVRHAMLTETLRKALPGGNADVLGSASLSAALLLRRQAEVVVADLETPAACADLLRFIQEFPAGVATVALVDGPSPAWVATALKAGVSAIISRDGEREELRLALEAAEAGLVLLHPTSAGELAAGGLANLALSDRDEDDELEHLTAREREVLRLMSDGLGNKQIAARLGVSEHTVKFHTSSILGKLGAGSRTEAVTEGIRRGLIVL